MKDRGPLWNARRKHSYMVTMLEQRRVKFAQRLAEDEARVEQARLELEALEKESK